MLFRSSFLQENKFEGADRYLQEFDNRKFVVELLKGETDYSLEQLFENPPSVDDDGNVEQRAASKLLNFRTLDGYGGRPAASKSVVNEIRQRIQTALDDAERMGYYPTKDAKYKNGQFLVGDKLVPIDELKGVRDLTIYSSDVRALNYTLPNLEYVHEFSPFTDFSLPKAKYIGELSFFGDSTITLPKDADVGLVRSASRVKAVVEGPERIRSVQLLDSYGDTNGMELTLPDTKYVTVVPPRGTPAGKISYRIRDILKQAGITEEDRKSTRLNSSHT